MSQAHLMPDDLDAHAVALNSDLVISGPGRCSKTDKHSTRTNSSRSNKQSTA